MGLLDLGAELIALKEEKEIMIKSKYFIIEELVDEKTYADRGDKAWELLDVNLLRVIDTLREHFGTAYINNWKWKKVDGMQNRGLRSPTSTLGTHYSQHRFGRAADITFKNFTAEQVRLAIKKDQKFWFDIGIRCIENNVTWLHVDVRNSLINSTITWFNP